MCSRRTQRDEAATPTIPQTFQIPFYILTSCPGFGVHLSKLLVKTLDAFTTQNAHQLAGHAGNLKFWLGAVRHCLGVLDGYGKRFNQLKAAQTAHIAKKGTYQFDLEDQFFESDEPVSPPKRAIKDSQLKELRRSVCDSAYRFLLRCYNQSLIDESCFKLSADDLGIAVDPSDVRG